MAPPPHSAGSVTHERDGRRTHKKRTSGRTPVLPDARTSSGMSNFPVAWHPAAGPATAGGGPRASGCLSGSCWGPRCSWEPFAGFHTWTVSCPGPTAGPPSAGGRRPCSAPASSSSPGRWPPSAAGWRTRISPEPSNPAPRIRIRSRCSWDLDGISWFKGKTSSSSSSSLDFELLAPESVMSRSCCGFYRAERMNRWQQVESRLPPRGNPDPHPLSAHTHTNKP